MMPARPPSLLGFRFGTGISDATQQVNPYLRGTGWDVIFTPVDLNVQETEFEVFHIFLDGPIGSAMTVLIDGKRWGSADGWNNEWDPSQPMIVRYGESVQFCWNTAFAAGPYTYPQNIQPSVALWLRRKEHAEVQL